MGNQNPISSVGAADLPGVRSLIASAIRGSVAESESGAEFLIADINETLDKWLNDPQDSVHLKYEVAGEILGVALVKNYWNLSTLFVAPAQQRQGIGRALMGEVLRVCGPASPRGKVEVNSSLVAVRFYETQGFRRTGRAHVRPGGCFHMEHVFAVASKLE
jgi:GNAT superfamily N-acetyltransferase